MAPSEKENYYKNKYEALITEYQNFSYTVAHDMQSPIRQMTGFVDILLDELGTELNEEQICYRDLIKDAATNAGKSLEYLLRFSSFNIRERKIETLDMNALIKACLEKFQKENADINIEEIPSARADKEMIEELLFYIIDNAYKFKDLKRPLSIKLGATQENDKTWYFVTDNGIGIHEDKISQALSLFKRLNSPDDYSGDGIGLTFAKKIVDMHDGEFNINSELGKGTTIAFTLPYN